MMDAFVFRYALAYILDLLIGDPYFLYHPVRLIGHLISFLEKLLYSFSKKILAGAFWS